LDALIRETNDARDQNGIQMLPVKDLIPNPNQPRRTFHEKSLEELAASIRAQGLLQPLLVRPCGPAKPGVYEIVAGERRWRASQLAGLTEVPVLVRSLSAQDTLAAALIENLQREDLNPLEEALGIQMLKEEFGLSQDDLSKKLGKSRSAIANSLRLLSLPDDARRDLSEGRLSPGHARCLLSIGEPNAQARLKNLIIERHLSVREAEGMAAAWKESGMLSWDAAPSAGLESVEQGATPSPQPNTREGVSDAAKNAASRPQSAKLLEIQNRIGATLNMAVRVTGKEDKGKISLSYTSQAELETLLRRLAAPALEGGGYLSLPDAAAPALEGREDPALRGRVLDAIEEAQRAPIAPPDAPPILSGSSRSALQGESKAAITSSERTALGGSVRQAIAAGDASVPEATNGQPS
jgi:ParB family chromosome partitioning protein